MTDFFDEMKLLESENGEDNDCAETFLTVSIKINLMFPHQKNQAGHSQIILRKTYDKN
jgi:hypothetical protein